jgi:folylpolyglutamate synthase/dihydropteroate synthase
VALAALSELARGPLSISADAVRHGPAAARWPRSSPAPRSRGLVDGAHNPEGCAGADARSADLGFEPPAAIVLAAECDKPAAAMLAALRGFAALPSW